MGVYTLEPQFADARSQPILCFGYAVGCWEDAAGRSHPSVRLTETELARVRAHLLPMAVHATPEELDAALRGLRLALFVPVQRQLAPPA